MVGACTGNDQRVVRRCVGLLLIMNTGEREATLKSNRSVVSLMRHETNNALCCFYLINHQSSFHGLAQL